MHIYTALEGEGTPAYLVTSRTAQLELILAGLDIYVARHRGLIQQLDVHL
jgi:hypothetical protein